MKITGRILVSAAIALTFALGGVGWSAFSGHGGPGGGRGAATSPEALASLAITDAQKTELKSIVARHRAAAAPALKELKAERQALARLIHSDPVDEEAIRKEEAKISALGADLAVARARFFHDLRGVFTAGQIEQVRTQKDARESEDARIDRLLGRIAAHLAKD